MPAIGRRLLSAVVPLIFAGVALAGCSVGVVDSAGNPTSLPPSKVAGDPVAVGGGWAFTTAQGAGEVRVYSARWAADTGGEYPTPPDNGAYLVLDVGVSVKDGGYTVNEFDWAATDSSGKSWPCVSKHWFEPWLPNGNVKAGATVRGNLACDVPRGAVVVRVGDDLGWSVPA